MKDTNICQCKYYSATVKTFTLAKSKQLELKQNKQQKIF